MADQLSHEAEFPVPRMLRDHMSPYNLETLNHPDIWNEYSNYLVENAESIGFNDAINSSYRSNLPIDSCVAIIITDYRIFRFMEVLVLSLSRPMSKELISRLKRLPNSTSYIRPDVTKEFSNFVLLLDLKDKILFQYNFQDGHQYRNFFRGSTKLSTASYFGTRSIIPRPHLTLMGQNWAPGLGDFFDRLSIVGPLYQTEPFPLLLHPLQIITVNVSSPLGPNVQTNEVRIGPSSNVKITLTSLSFTTSREFTCAGIECVRIFM